MSTRRVTRSVIPIVRLGAALSTFALTIGCAVEPAPVAVAPPGSSPTGSEPVAPAPPVAATPAREPINPRLLRRFRPVATETTTTPRPSPELVDLGRMLWFEPRFSKDGTISCNSCHDLGKYGADGRPTSVGDAGRRGRRNAPTVYNTAEHFVLLWDGRASDAVKQATMPIENPIEMGSSRERVESFLGSIPEYRERFAKAFPGGGQPTLEQVAEALAAFERGLETISRWDEFLAGREDALTDGEVHGLRLFLDLGCVTCHTGPQVGASSFQRAGAVEPWPNQADKGRFELTNDPADLMLFKVPTLKNVARTGPYFHDGSSADLADAVRRMGRYQLGLTLEPGEVDALVQFLEALTGELPRDYIAAPALPRAVAHGQ